MSATTMPYGFKTKDGSTVGTTYNRFVAVLKARTWGKHSAITLK
jgi:hypothetical protein